MFRGVSRAALVAAFLLCALAPASAGGSTAEVDASSRAGGNRKAVATRIGRALFTTVWPAQIVKVRVDGVGTHDVAGLIVSGVKFHARLDDAAFTREIDALVRLTFAASDVEEVDVWATVPLAASPRGAVAGDYAQPISRIVYGATVARAELATFAARLQRGDDVFWDRDWRAGLGRQTPLPSTNGKG